MKVSIQNFRCFQKLGEIEIKPINILVGQNNAGKTSFLAAMRFLLDLFHRRTKASFNRDPFHLGSYDEIAHVRGGSSGRAKEFVFKIENGIDQKAVLRNIQRLPALRSTSIERSLPTSFSLTVAFKNDRSQPAISYVSFEAGAYSFRAEYGTELSVTITTPKLKSFELRDKYLSAANNFDPLQYDLSYIDFVLRDFRFLVEIDEKNLIKEHTEELAALNHIYRSIARAAPGEVYASAPMRSKPERTYNPAESNPSPEGTHIPFVLAQMEFFDKDQWKKIEAPLARFGVASGLFDKIGIKRLSESASGPFQVIVSSEGVRSNLIDTGYGVSQVLPIIADVLRARSRTLFLFQQPEVHLHPKAQAELSTFFAQIVAERRHTLIIETHSDYLIDRIRTDIRDKKILRPRDVSLLYFEKIGRESVVHQLTFDNDGNVRGAPPGYRDFFIQEELRSLGVSKV